MNLKALIVIILFTLILSKSINSQVIPPIHQDKNNTGKIEFYLINNGIFGHNYNKNKPGFIWPRDSNAQYIYGGGFYMLATSESGEVVPLFNYDPNEAKSWFVPGSVEDGLEFDEDRSSKYRVFNSRNYDKNSGEPKFGAGGPNWPLWEIFNNNRSRNLGLYIVDEEDRNTETFRKPVFLGDEDLVSISKDSDTLYNRGNTLYENSYPIFVEMETRVSSFDEERLRDMLYITYGLKNKAQETLEDIYFAPIFDIDITDKRQFIRGIDNDNVEMWDDGNIITFSTELGGYEKDITPGYISFKWIYTPTVNNDTIAKTPEYPNLETYPPKQLPIDKNIYNSDEMLSFITNSSEYNNDSDQRLLMPTKRFHLGGRETAFFTLAINMTEANEDYPELDEATKQSIRNDLEYYESYFNDFLTDVEIERNEESQIVKVFPNPVLDGEFNLTIDSEKARHLKIELLSLSGKNLGTIFEGVKNRNQYQFNTENYSSGVYFLKIQLDDKTFIKKLNIINNGR